MPASRRIEKYAWVGDLSVSGKLDLHYNLASTKVERCNEFTSAF
jgi:hypothetical protein